MNRTLLSILGPVLLGATLLLGSVPPCTAGAMFRFPKLPDGHFGLGPGVGLSLSPEGPGIAFNLDASVSWKLLTGSLNLLLQTDSDGVRWGARLEGSIWLLLNFGGGVGYLFGPDSGVSFHAFAGLPLPIPGKLRRRRKRRGKCCPAQHSRQRFWRLGYIEPFVRINFLPWAKGGLHWIYEIGLMFKVTDWKP